MPREYRSAASEYLKEFYYDSVNFDGHALQLAIDFAGADHILGAATIPSDRKPAKMLDSIPAEYLGSGSRSDPRWKRGGGCSSGFTAPLTALRATLSPLTRGEGSQILAPPEGRMRARSTLRIGNSVRAI